MKIPGIRATVGQMLNRARNAVWPQDSFAPRPPKRFLRFLLALLVISAMAGGGAVLLRMTGYDLSAEAWSTTQVTAAAQNRLKSIAYSLDSARDWLSGDAPLLAAVAQRNTAQLFQLLAERDNEFSSRLPDSVRFGNPGTNRGYAVYSTDGKLLAWYSPVAATFGFDTTLAGDFLLPSHDRGLLLENGPIYAYLIAIRKIVSPNGQIQAYVASKQLLATKEPLTGNAASSVFDDIPAHAHRDLTFVFGGRSGVARSERTWFRRDLFADPGDPTSFVGTISVSQIPEPVPSLEYRLLHNLWTFALTLAIFSALLWLLISIAEAPHREHPVMLRIDRSAIAILAIVIARIAIAFLGAAGKVFGPQYQDATDYASDWAFGIAGNPLELFLTSVFATAAAVMLWIIWMPRERLVRDESRERTSEPRTTPAIVLLVFAVAVVLVSQGLIDLLSITTEAIVRNSSLRYLNVDRVLPAPGMLMMLLSFLGIGITYLFLAVLVLTFGLRSTVHLVSRQLKVPTRILLGTVCMAVFAALGLFAFDRFGWSDTSLLNRTAFTVLTFLVSVSIIVLDATLADPLDRGPSFLYKLPRSSRSILFILAGSAIIMSPLIATKQLLSDKEVAHRMVLENAEVDTPELENAATHLLSSARDRLNLWQTNGHDTAALHDQAFLIWLDGMREHPQWNVSIDVSNAAGTRESHFATLGAVPELEHLKPNLDSESLRLHRLDTVSMTLAMLPAFTTAGTPAVFGGIRFHDTTRSAHAGGNGSVAAPLFVTIALWSDFPALASSRSQISIVGSNVESSATDGFIVAQYRPNARRVTNMPALDVPSTVPSAVSKLLRHARSAWAPTTINGAPYQTLYYRSTPDVRRGEVPIVVAVSIPEPTYGRTLEFALRLNAIGLLYGSLIVLVLLIVRQIVTRRLRFTLHFRDRIFLVVLVIALVPLIVVTNVTRNLLAERAQVEQQDRLTRDAIVIRDRMMRTLPSDRQADLQAEVDYLSQVIGRDFSVYDAVGRLRASSRPELYESSLLSSTLNSTAVREVILGQRSFFTEPVSIGSNVFNVGYQPVTSADGSRLLAVLALATMDEQPQIEAEIARTTSFIYGTFAALGLVLLGIGALFAARVASPILELIRATERVAQGTLKTSIPVTREDEIGDLMHAFNAMTRELERSREIVAQTERELAWKEMARQVAHEIKNPLTPMKLSVQHLEHAHEAKDPNFNSIFRRVVRTLREQIDVLTRIATEFSHFGAMPRRRWGAVDIRKVADSAVALFDSERNRIRFIVDVPKDLPRVHSDEEELRRAFVNLLRNAVQAIEGWGVIVIHARSDQGMVNIRLRDTGFGMQEETLKKIFDPNFSTKTSGMGLGLAIVKKTITDMSGTIRVESQPGHGTTFFIDLPARADLGEETY